MSKHTQGPWGRNGKLVSDAREEVGGWRVVKRVTIPASAGKQPYFGEPIALVARTKRHMTRSMILAALAVATLAGCGATQIPLYDKAGVTRDEEFRDRVACVKTDPIMFPGAKIRRCMESRGYQLVGYDFL